MLTLRSPLNERLPYAGCNSDVDISAPSRTSSLGTTDNALALDEWRSIRARRRDEHDRPNSSQGST